MSSEIKKSEEINIEQNLEISQTYSGPIPPPAMMNDYKKIDPNFPDRLIKMSEDNLKHIHKIQKVEVYTESVATILGIVCAALISIYAIYKGGEIIMAGNSVAGTILAGVGLTSLVGTFINGTNNKKEKS